MAQLVSALASRAGALACSRHAHPTQQQAQWHRELLLKQQVKQQTQELQHKEQCAQNSERVLLQQLNAEQQVTRATQQAALQLQAQLDDLHTTAADQQQALEAEMISLAAQLHELRARHMQELQAERARLRDSQQGLADCAAAQMHLLQKAKEAEQAAGVAKDQLRKTEAELAEAKKHAPDWERDYEVLSDMSDAQEQQLEQQQQRYHRAVYEYEALLVQASAGVIRPTDALAATDPNDLTSDQERRAVAAARDGFISRYTQLMGALASQGVHGVMGCAAAALCSVYLWHKADAVVIRQVFRSLCILVHPDKQGCTMEFRELKEMHDLLLCLLPAA